MVGLLPNCCIHVCRCLPRALFPGINPVRDKMLQFLFSDDMTQESHMPNFDRFKQTRLNENLPENIFI